MDWKLFLSTFGLIFLVELGDKSQLAAMAQATGGPEAKWPVFFGASAALVLSMLIAVLLGDALTRLIDPRYLKLAAGAMFLVFGGVVLREAVTPESAVPDESEASADSRGRGALAELVLGLDAEFEEAARNNYLKLAETTADDNVRRVALALAEEEGEHVRYVRGLQKKHQGVRLAGTPEQQVLPSESDWLHAPTDQENLDIILDHENRQAAFHESLARHMPTRVARDALRQLAKEDRQHAERISTVVRGQS